MAKGRLLPSREQCEAGTISSQWPSPPGSQALSAPGSFPAAGKAVTLEYPPHGFPVTARQKQQTLKSPIFSFLCVRFLAAGKDLPLASQTSVCLPVRRNRSLRGGRRSRSKNTGKDFPETQLPEEDHSHCSCPGLICTQASWVNTGHLAYSLL